MYDLDAHAARIRAKRARRARTINRRTARRVKSAALFLSFAFPASEA